MKKILLVSAMALAAGFSYAQTITPKVGLTLSNITTGDSDEDSKSKPGFTLGAAFNFPVNEMFSIQPELSFVQKGAKGEYTENYSDGGIPVAYKVESKGTINYLEIPVLAKLTFGEGTKFFINAGPSLGFGLGGKTKIESTYTAGGQSQTEKVDGKIKFGDPDEDANEEDTYFDNRMDFGLQLGAGVLIGDKIQIDVRYGLGLSSLYDNEDDDIDVGGKNRVIQFTVGIPLSLGGK